MNNFEITFLTDSVDLSKCKIYALGIGWDVLFAQSFPAQHHRSGLGILVTVPYLETNSDR